MKLFKFFSHPLLLILLFCAILISGQSFGGFYLMYLVMALPGGAGFSIVAAIGIGLIIFNLLKLKRSKQYRIEAIVNIIGACLLILSLIMFFHNDKNNYNQQTFYQVVPMLTIMLFIITTVCFVINNVINLSFSHSKGRLKT